MSNTENNLSKPVQDPYKNAPQDFEFDKKLQEKDELLKSKEYFYRVLYSFK